MADPWHSLATSFAYGHQMAQASAGRVPLRRLQPRLSSALQASIDVLDLWEDEAVLVDLHGVRAPGARAALSDLMDTPLWVVSTGKGKGVMRDVLTEVVLESDTHRVVYWTGATPQRPVPSLAVVATHTLADAVDDMTSVAVNEKGRSTWWFILAAGLLSLWAICG